MSKLWKKQKATAWCEHDSGFYLEARALSLSLRSLVYIGMNYNLHADSNR